MKKMIQSVKIFTVNNDVCRVKLDFPVQGHILCRLSMYEVVTYTDQVRTHVMYVYWQL